MRAPEYRKPAPRPSREPRPEPEYPQNRQRRTIIRCTGCDGSLPSTGRRDVWQGQHGACFPLSSCSAERSAGPGSNELATDILAERIVNTHFKTLVRPLLRSIDRTALVHRLTTRAASNRNFCSVKPNRSAAPARPPVMSEGLG